MTLSAIDAGIPERLAVWRFVLLALAAPMLMGAVAAWLESQHAHTQRLRAAADLSFQRRLEAGNLIARIADAESSQRGFVITGDQRFLAGYAPARADADRTFAKLRRELADEPQQLKLLAQLRALAIQKFAEMDEVLAKRRISLEAAAQRVQQGRGRLLMDAMRRVSAQMIREAEATRAQRTQRLDERLELNRVALWIGIAAIALVLLAAAILVWRQSVSRYRARLAAHSVNERNRSILNSTIDAIIILNPSGSIETLNPAATKLIGYRPEEVARRDVSMLIDLGGEPETFHQRVGLAQGVIATPFLPDRRVRHKDGRVVPVDITLGVMPQPDGEHIVASVRDISDRKRIEQLKDELMSTVSHELRTPLTSVVGALGLLRAGSAGEIPAAARRLIEIAENNSRRLIRLINDMLDIDRIQSGRLRLERQMLDLVEVVSLACEGSRGLAEGEGVQLCTDLPEQSLLALGDSDRLVQVITNLVSNAIRATPRGGTVTVGLSRDRHGGKAQISVDDDGPGVPAEFRDRIFGRFERADGERSSGTGLGLAISREIINRHDGRIWFEDRAEGGTRFAFTLDLIRDGAGESEADTGSSILIVEDDAEIAETLREMVLAVGHRAHCVANAAEARKAIAEGSYVALLLDLILPDESGLSLAHALRTRNGRSSIPIIIVSALARDGVKEPVPLDIVDWIEKPIDAERLAAAIRAALARTGAKRPTVLHLDDDPDMLDIVASVLSRDARVLKATDLASARAILDVVSPDAAILDLHLAEGSGLELLPMLTDASGLAVPTIIFSAHEVSAAAAASVDAVLVKSRGSLPDLRATVERVLNDRVGGAVDVDRP